MRGFLQILTENAIVVIDLMATLLIIIGTVEAFVGGFVAWSKPNHEKREVWLRYARWLIAGLTFQLAADIIETSIRTNWAAIGQLAAVAVIRTFLNYFLEKDLAETRERQREPARSASAKE